MSPTIREEPPEELEEVRAGRLPARYGYRLQDKLMERLRPLLLPGVKILDVGAGRSPTLALDDRPQGCVYVGLDIAPEELEAAEPGSYNRAVVHDISAPAPGLTDFDLIISWQVLEHVEHLDAALENLRAMLCPGGVLLCMLSGTWAIFSLAARVMPHRVRVAAMSHFLGHAEELKFPTHHDHCWASAIGRILSTWSSFELVPFYRGATYLSMSRVLQRGYLGYEDLIARHDIRNLATHYMIIARG
ncbi:MAG: class I SAM-dependent methyltransferase [Solirubrobacteraceae bacterium]